MQTITEIVNKIQEIANKNQSNPELRKVTIPHLNCGECYRQGDLYVFKVEDDHPVGEELDRRQLANGQSIGQRHVILGGKFKVYKGVKQPKLPKGYEYDPLHAKAGLGYVFDILELGEDCRNAHPEHSHFIFTQCGRYQVMHQLDRQTLRRVAD